MTRTVTKPPILVTVITTLPILLLLIACNQLKIEVQQPISSFVCVAAKVNSIPVTRTFSNFTKRYRATTPVPTIKPLASVASLPQYQLDEGDLSLWYLQFSKLCLALCMFSSIVTFIIFLGSINNK